MTERWFELGGSRTDTIPGLFVESKSIYGLPARDVEKIHVPGRNGDVLIDRKSYQNIGVTYKCAITNYAALDALIRLLILGKQTSKLWSGYQLLRDSYTEYERLAVLSDAIPMDEIISRKLLRFPVKFDCKPQKYYNRNEVVGFTNPPEATSRPVGVAVNNFSDFNHISTAMRVEIVAAGDISFSFERIGIFSVPGLVAPNYIGEIGQYERPSLVIDSEAMVAYKYLVDGTRVNVDIPFFPDYTSYMNITLMSGTIHSALFYPRWWCL